MPALQIRGPLLVVAVSRTVSELALLGSYIAVFGYSLSRLRLFRALIL